VGETTGAVAEKISPFATPAHELDTFERSQCPDEDGAAYTFPFTNYIQEFVYAIREVDVGETGAAKDGTVAQGGSFVGVAGRVLGPVRLGLDDYARGSASGGLMNEHATQEVYGHLSGISIVEGGREYVRRGHCSPVRSVMRRES
jgi:hypothetical protein